MPPPDTTNYNKGSIIVLFKDKIREELARNLVKKFRLSAGEWNEIIQKLIVQVPVGEEIKWRTEFNKYPLIVEVAALHAKEVAEARARDDPFDKK